MIIEQYFSEEWKELWKKSGFKKLSPIQEKSFSLLSNKKNVLGVSPTGSGKTLAYLLPLLSKLEQKKNSQLLILLPSQELAMQVAFVAKKWSVPLGVHVQTLIGGANKKRQIEKLKMKPEVIVGTPGRVLELIKERKIKPNEFQTIVLDEVDQLIENQEINLTQEIVKRLDRNIQIVLFSATGDRVENQIETMFSKAFDVIDVTNEDQSTEATEHTFLEVNNRRKIEFLRRLANIQDFRALVFFNNLAEMGVAASKLEYEGIRLATLASDQNKMARKLAIHAFEEQKVTFLLTTDVASRGLDFSDLYYVVQFDLPKTTASYIHRSGRVGRMGKAGEVLTLVNQEEEKKYQKLLDTLFLTPVERTLYAGTLLSKKEYIEQKKSFDEKGKGSSKKEASMTNTSGKKKNLVKQSQASSSEVKKKKKKKQKINKNKGKRRNSTDSSTKNKE